MRRRRPGVVALALCALIATACTSSRSPPTGPPDAPTSPADTRTSTPGDATSPTAGASPSAYGPVLDPEDLRLPEVGFAFGVEPGLALVARSGDPLGLLPGFALSGEASARLARPVVLDAADRTWALGRSGLTALDADATLPLAGGAVLEASPAADGEPGFALRLRRGDGSQQLPSVRSWDDVAISSVWDTVSLLPPGTAFDIHGQEIGLEPGCWVSDSHDEDRYLVCGASPQDTSVVRVHDGSTDQVLATGLPKTRGRWVDAQIGPDATTLLAQWIGDGGCPVAVLADTDGAAHAVAPGTPTRTLFWRSGGTFWAARLGGACADPRSPPPALIEVDPADGYAVLVEVPGATDAAIWIG